MGEAPLSAQGVEHRLIRLPAYEADLRSLRKLEPKLHQEVRKCLEHDLEGGQLDEVQGTGGWAKGRVASPSRAIGKSGGFRVIYLYLRVQQDIYLQMVYDKRQKLSLSGREKEKLREIARAIKAAGLGGKHA